ncbi:DEAD/DEAH box helicase [Streptomyces sp. WAC05374]|uniref:DEAD/DEAH box helicase n=1 Tax=Streptomyces sp. WAC05374 TaxID=2487420 RepID=UPI000F8615D8|nr:DEAD/DEAH box helicase [Streptomyces sp. WAC05374]RST06379.1 DEAD/DEAH box helicase [Streptomyces sp. WAC05374]TDF37910.1 DEAD/DEAH box helicase [Streptomyces sp. WAC05374]TDF52766.1 DEAD/DEAH box helicase [Streptomyces sp. WAC05374]TDF54185.1 DEAD/DEAH box helicase [Streptomyces sp. WAC05374]
MNAKPPVPGHARAGKPQEPTAAARGDLPAPGTVVPGRQPAESFEALGLPPKLLETMTRLGVTEPFPIQAATLPDALAGRDVLGRARTGSGKTLAFGLALLVRTAGLRAEPKRPLGLVLVPTRELAQQVGDALAPYARALGVRMATAVGGLSINRQVAELRTGAEVVVATPGRLADLLSRRDCHLNQVRITVLDEADQMCDLGFLPQVSEILGQVRPDGQRLLFSATLDRDVDELVRGHLHDPVLVSVDRVASPVDTVEHHVLNVHAADKYATGTEIAARDGRVLMFLDTKAGVDQFTRHLRAVGVQAAALHSGKSQPQRTHTLARFKEGEITVLVATNVAARGIHIDALDLVVNVDPPAEAKDYLHRGGRTARAGASGKVVTLVTPGQRREVNRMMSEAGIRPTVTQVRSGEQSLTAITGAKRPPTPSGERTGNGNAPFRGLGTRPGRPAKESRKATEARRIAEARAAARVRKGR